MIKPIVLAAGLSTRMGAIKALLPIDGKPALVAVLRTIESAGLQSPIVVLGHNASEVRRIEMVQPLIVGYCSTILAYSRDGSVIASIYVYSELCAISGCLLRYGKRSHY